MAEASLFVNIYFVKVIMDHFQEFHRHHLAAKKLVYEKDRTLLYGHKLEEFISQLKDQFECLNKQFPDDESFIVNHSIYSDKDQILYVNGLFTLNIFTICNIIK